MPRCLNCQKIFHESYCQKGRQKYCSIVCRNKTWRRINANNMTEIKRTYHKTYSQRLRIRVLNHYGGLPPKCACCGESQIEFLCIDHIHGGGIKYRREAKGGHFYQWLKNNNFPEGYQVLCHNCNMAKGFYGYCPHKDKIKSINIDYLSIMLELQSDFQASYNMYPSLDKIASAIGAESIGELWKVSGGKWWSKKENTHIERLGEIVDILHFFLQYMIAEKISVKELYDAYRAKLKINYERQEHGY